MFTVPYIDFTVLLRNFWQSIKSWNNKNIKWKQHKHVKSSDYVIKRTRIDKYTDMREDIHTRMHAYVHAHVENMLMQGHIHWHAKMHDRLHMNDIFWMK